MTASASNYVILYLLFMVPTYLLSWVGSNSSLILLATLGTNPFFWMHLIALVFLCLLAHSRGHRIGKPWLVWLPVLALIFDLAPVLNLIPFVPTALHLLAIVLGLSPAPRPA